MKKSKVQDIASCYGYNNKLANYRWVCRLCKIKLKVKLKAVLGTLGYAYLLCM